MRMIEATKEALIEQRRALNDRIDAIEQQERQQRFAALVGKCFKYRNSYGSGSSWWLYTKVVAAKDGELTSKQFEIRTGGAMTACTTTAMWAPRDDYTPISVAEYQKAWAKFLQKVQQFGEDGSNV